ncbi:putative membrane-associated metalloprotease domain protein [Clostridioides difficile CD69]|nr:putative membrane-associated metalloprotease domain protein [Clostridioides difficile CD69]
MVIEFGNGILIAVVLCLLYFITYFKIDLITPKSLFYQLLKTLSRQSPIENKVN